MKKNKGRDPIFKCCICGKYISYNDIKENEILSSFTPDTIFTVEKTELSHKKCSKHSKCKGFKTPDYGWGSDFDCGYNTTIDCDQCKYCAGRKDPEAKINQPK